MNKKDKSIYTHRGHIQRSYTVHINYTEMAHTHVRTHTHTYIHTHTHTHIYIYIYIYI